MVVFEGRLWGGEAAVPTRASGCQCGVSNNMTEAERGDRENEWWKRWTRWLKGKRSWCSEAKKRLESLLFFISLLLGSGSTSQSPNSAVACVCWIVLLVLSACFPACDGGIPWCGRLVGRLINAPEPRRCECVCVTVHAHTQAVRTKAN